MLQFLLVHLGAYSPLTAEGNIVVKRILASCHAYVDHDLAHFVIMPMQWYPKVINWIFGTNNGFPGYVTIANDLGRWMIPFKF